MDRVLTGILRQQCIVYLDDILAHGELLQDSTCLPASGSGESSWAGLKLHPDKCHFLRREVTFLGHKVGGEGISTMGDIVQAVQDWPTPTDTRQLKTFPGLASYYRHFVRGFSCGRSPVPPATEGQGVSVGRGLPVCLRDLQGSSHRSPGALTS